MCFSFPDMVFRWEGVDSTRHSKGVAENLDFPKL